MLAKHSPRSAALAAATGLTGAAHDRRLVEGVWGCPPVSAAPVWR